MTRIYMSILLVGSIAPTASDTHRVGRWTVFGTAHLAIKHRVCQHMFMVWRVMIFYYISSFLYKRAWYCSISRNGPGGGKTGLDNEVVLRHRLWRS